MQQCASKQNACFHFMIRWSRPHTPENLKILRDWLKSKNAKYVFQAELTVSEDGKQNPHYQGFMHTKNRFRPAQLATDCNKPGNPHAMEVQVCHDHGAVKRYSMKDDTRVAGPWADKVLYMGEDLPTDADLYPWQRSLEEILASPPGDRKILWIYDPVGNTGKTKLAKRLATKQDAIVLGYANKNDAINLVYKNQNHRIYIWNLTRTKPATISETELYSAIEEVKDGMFMNSKYETGMCVMKCPHVVVLSNTVPQYGSISADRWQVMEITPAKELRRLIRVEGAEVLPRFAPGHLGQPFNPPHHSAASTMKDVAVQTPVQQTIYSWFPEVSSDAETEVLENQPDCDFVDLPPDEDLRSEYDAQDFIDLTREIDENDVNPDLVEEQYRILRAIAGKNDIDDDDYDWETVRKKRKRKKRKCLFIDDEAEE